MASLVSLTADEIISLTADSNVKHTYKEEVNEKGNNAENDDDADMMMAPPRGESRNPIQATTDDDDPVPFCTSGSMNTHSYHLQGGTDNTGGMIMYMDGTHLD